MRFISQSYVRKAFRNIYWGVGIITLLSISYIALMPIRMQAQNQIECTAPGNCNGWLCHKNKIGIGLGSGIQLKDNGNVQVGSGITQVNIGKSYSNAPYYLSSYIGFNAQRNIQGQWTFKGDGGNNGGVAMLIDVAGNLRIVT